MSNSLAFLMDPMDCIEPSGVYPIKSDHLKGPNPHLLLKALTVLQFQAWIGLLPATGLNSAQEGELASVTREKAVCLDSPQQKALPHRTLVFLQWALASSQYLKRTRLSTLTQW